VKRPRTLLFDTQAVVFWATGKIPKPVVQRVNAGYAVCVSVISPWEFLLKSRTHGFGLDYNQFLATVHALQAEFLPIELSHLERLRGLPFREQHRDPFDRLIISQAMQDKLILVGGDEEFPAYPLPVLWDKFWEASSSRF